MATWTEAGETWNTTAGNKTVVATPVANDLIVVVTGASDMIAADTLTISDNNADGLGTYSRAERGEGGGTVGRLEIWVRNRLIGSATSTTFTATISGDTGGGLTVMRLSGMTWTGLSSLRQTRGESTQTENPPSISFTQAPLTANAVLLAVFCEDNPAALTAPAGFTETTDIGWATPTSGIEVCFANSGITSATNGWTGGAATDHCEVGAEFDISTFSASTHSAAMRDQATKMSGMVGILRK